MKAMYVTIHLTNSIDPMRVKVGGRATIKNYPEWMLMVMNQRYKTYLRR